MENQYDCLYMIKELHDGVKRHADNVLRRYDLTMVQMGALVLLDHRAAGECTFKELEQLLHLAQSTTVEIVRRLEQKGYVTTSTDAHDKRIKKVHITQVGATLSANAAAMVQSMNEKMFLGLTDEEIETLLRVMKKIYSNIQFKENH